MTNREALEAFKQQKPLDQETVRRLVRAGLLNARNVTNMDTPHGAEEFLPISLTPKGEKHLIKSRESRKKRTRKKTWYRRIAAVATTVGGKISLGVVISIVSLSLYYKYTGADDLRSKVYSPLNAELGGLGQCVAANTASQPCTTHVLSSLQQSGDFYRMPKSLQRDLTSAYEDAGLLEGDVERLTERLERQLSSKIEALRSEDSDRVWRLAAVAHIRAEELRRPGRSPMRSFTFNHAARGRGMDLSNPNNPLISDPGGPTWQINDWLAFPQSVEKVDSLWTDDDYLYFDDLRDLWYYRITRQDLTLHKLTLQSFLQPVHDILVGDADFQAIAKKQPEVSKRLAQLKSKVADRVADPKKLSDVPQLIWGTVTPVTIVKDVFRIAELWIHGAEMWVKEPDAVHLRLPISGTLTSADGRTVTLDTLE